MTRLASRRSIVRGSLPLAFLAACRSREGANRSRAALEYLAGRGINDSLLIEEASLTAEGGRLCIPWPGPDGQPVAQRPVADEPAFRAAWYHCEQAAAGDNYFVPVAARSGAALVVVAAASSARNCIADVPMRLPSSMAVIRVSTASE